MFPAKTRRWEISWLVVYMVLLLASNVAYDFVMRPYLINHHMDFSLESLIGLTWSVIFWIIPAFLYIISVNRCHPLMYLKLNTNPGKGLLWIAAGILWFVVALGYRHLLQGRPINLHLGFGAWLNMVMLAGFIEEIPLRGVVFQKLNEFLNFWLAGSISSFVFVCLHFPYWISIGMPLLSFLTTSLSIFVFALFLCFVLKRSGSLWADIVIHGLNNLLSLLV